MAQFSIKKLDTKTYKSLEEYYQSVIDLVYAAKGKMIYSSEEKIEFTERLKDSYDEASKEFRGDTLVPSKDTFLKDIVISQYYDAIEKKDKHFVQYRFNDDPTDPDSEFETKGRERNPTITVGTVLDRLGSPTGKYVSPCDKNRVFTVTERALPYYFVENKVYEEPSYHRYEVIREINYTDLISEIEKKLKDINIYPDLFPTKAEWNRVRDLMKDNIIMFGNVAAVDAFEPQGDGKGKQYRFPIGIKYLVELGFIKEVKV